MSERIDHAAESMACLVAADNDVSAEMALNTGEYRSDVLAFAQVHATLALVEQQRIANLIALEVATEPRNHESYVLHNAQTDINAKFPDYQLRPDIRSALGL